MDAELLIKGVKLICQGRDEDCSFAGVNCRLWDVKVNDCCARPDYHGDVDPIYVVKKYLVEHPEPKPLPVPLQNGTSTYGDIIDTINRLIAHLAAKEEAQNEPKK